MLRDLYLDRDLSYGGVGDLEFESAYFAVDLKSLARWDTAFSKDLKIFTFFAFSSSFSCSNCNLVASSSCIAVASCSMVYISSLD